MFQLTEQEIGRLEITFCDIQFLSLVMNKIKIYE